MKYLIVIEKSETGYSAYSPDLPGCVSTGATPEETEANMKEAIELHIEGLKEEGLSIPKPSSLSSYVEVAAYPPQRMRALSGRPTAVTLGRSCGPLAAQNIH